MKSETKTICLNFKQELDRFTESVYTLIKDGGLPKQKAFLCDMAENINKLYDSSIRIVESDEEDVQEIGKLVQNIFLQPLATKKEKELTILNAMESFSSEEAQDSELSYILQEYTSHPETTKSFIRELELLSEDLDSALKESA